MLGACAVRAPGALLGFPHIFICTRLVSCGPGTGHTAAVAACPSNVVCSGVATGKQGTPRCQRSSVPVLTHHGMCLEGGLAVAVGDMSPAVVRTGAP